jgi:plasmid stabilization system protein ParE
VGQFSVGANSHFVMFRIGYEQGREVIEVLRLLHDAMDLQRHLPSADESK